MFNFSLCLSSLLSSSLNILIITLNSLLGRLFISTSLSFSVVLYCSFIWNIFLCCLIFLNLLFLFLCIWKVIYISQLWRSGFFVGHVLGIPAAHSPLVNRAIYSSVPLYGLSVLVASPALWRGYQSLVGRAGSQSGWFQSSSSSWG